MRRRALLLAALPPLLAGAGCATAPMGQALLAARPADLPPAAQAAGVPFFPQDDTLCGPAVLASLLAAAGRPVPMDTLVPQVYLPGRAGTLQAEMLAGVRRQGLLALPLAPRLADALAEVAAGRPVAVLLNLSLPVWPRWHYAVLTGYDLPAGRVRLHSGLMADAEWPLATFEHTWARSGAWSFVALPPGQLPTRADEAAVTAALLALDPVAAPQDSAPAWGAAARRWPDAPLLALGEANAWLAAGEVERAVAGYAQAAARFDSAVAWNNLAQARLRQGDRAGARAAAERARQRVETAEPQWRAAVQRTLQAIGPPDVAPAGRKTPP